MENLNFIIAKRLVDLRKKNKLTQLELAEKLNYSDKAVSKWEQGESVPSIEVLCRLSELYNVSLDYIVGKVTEKTVVPPPVIKNRSIITLLSVLAVWFAAIVGYVFVDMFTMLRPWMFFCWAVPASFLVALVFSAIWRGKRLFFTFLSLFLWTLLLCFCLQFMSYNIWTILGIGAPLQIAVLLWAWLVK